MLLRMPLCISLIIRSKIARRTTPAPVLKGKNYHYQDYDDDNIGHRSTPFVPKTFPVYKYMKHSKKARAKGKISLKNPSLSSIMILG
jgi:hypothetical protein